jgi:hypothetical protein
VTWNTDRTVSPVVARLVVMDNEKRMTLWCRMWSEDPALAHDLMSESCVQWSNRRESLDSVVGPTEQERFVTGYRTRQANTFDPRVLVDAGDRFAYLWDVRSRDGKVLTGLDVNVMKDDRVEENWTFVGTRRCEWPDPAPEAPASADPAAIDSLVRRWVRLRSGRAELAEDLVTDDFALFCGEGPTGDVSGPAELAALVERQTDTAFATHREPMIDLTRGHVTFLWTARSTPDGAAVGGVDLLTVRDGRFARAWSLTGTRPFRY